MWMFLAAGSAFFAGNTAKLEKCGIKRTGSDVATAALLLIILGTLLML